MRILLVVLLCSSAIAVSNRGQSGQSLSPQPTTAKPHEPCLLDETVADVVRSRAVCMRALGVGFGGFRLTDSMSTKRLGTGYCDTFLPLPSCCIEKCAWRKRCVDGQFVADVQDYVKDPKILCCTTVGHVISGTECQWFEIVRRRKDKSKDIKIDKEIKNHHGLNDTAFITKLVIVDERPMKMVARLELCNATVNLEADCVNRDSIDKVVGLVGAAVGIPAGVAIPIGIVVGIFQNEVVCPTLSLAPYDVNLLPTMQGYGCISYTPASPTVTGNSEGDTATIPKCPGSAMAVGYDGLMFGKNADEASYDTLVNGDGSLGSFHQYNSQVVLTCKSGQWVSSTLIDVNFETVAVTDLSAYACSCCTDCSVV